jgi:putative intracellular protease/amidase
MSRIVMPIPLFDFDPTETGVTWKMLTQAGVKIVFATPNAQAGAADSRMITGEGLGPWSWFLKADHNGQRAYREMIESEEFCKPIAWEQISVADFDGIALPGGHAPRMKSYLESETLQKKISEFFKSSKIVGAICHGVVLAARSKDSAGKSVLAGRKATALLRSQELAAWALTCLWLKNYYRTYRETVQAEVTRNLGNPRNFISGPAPLKRDSMENLDAGFFVEDRNLISARWPGDSHRFGCAVARRLNERAAR